MVKLALSTLLFCGCGLKIEDPYESDDDDAGRGDFASSDGGSGGGGTSGGASGGSGGSGTSGGSGGSGSGGESGGGSSGDLGGASGGGSTGGSGGSFVPVAVGFEFSGIWDEQNQQLLDYVYPRELTDSGERIGARAGVVVTLATMEYFSAETEAAREGESCSWFAYFSGPVVGGELIDPVPYDINAQQFNYDAGTGSSGVLGDVWDGAAWEGGLVANWNTLDERCLDWEDGELLDLFHGMHFGLGFGEMTPHLLGLYEDSDGWDPAEDPFSYFTMFTAMNHPNDESARGYDFVGYDFTTGLYVEVDRDVCVTEDFEDGTTKEFCGEFGIDRTEDGTGYRYRTGDFREYEGSRFAYVVGNAWWYEDFPNLDLNLMKEGFEMDLGSEE